MESWKAREARTDRRFALIAQVLANLHRGPEDEAFDITDFMPLTQQDRDAADRAKTARTAERIVAALNESEPMYQKMRAEMKAGQNG